MMSLEKKLLQLTSHEENLLKYYQEYLGSISLDMLLKNFHSYKTELPIQPSFITEDVGQLTDSNYFFKQHRRFSSVNTHKHQYIEMAYIYKGNIYETINGNKITLTEGDLVILDTNVRHSIEVAGYKDIMLNFALNLEYFNTAFFMQLTEFNEKNLLSSFLLQSIYEQHKYNTFLFFETKDNDTIKFLIEKMTFEFLSPNIGSNTIINKCLIMLFIELIRLYDKQQQLEQLTNSINSTYEIIQYIEKNYLNATLESTATYFNFNSSYFSSLVKKRTGKNFKDIILEKKMNKAAQLLRNTDMTIEEICLNLNISNINFFYKRFKKQFNLTPREYRKT